MSAGVMPLILGLGSAAAKGLPSGNGPFTSFAYFGNVFFEWRAEIAVPLGVMVSWLVALTLGYRMLVGRLANLAFPRN
jgi:hypothetical protein